MKKLAFYVFIIASILAIPWCMQRLMNTWFINSNVGNNDSWLGFWGGYLGSILSVFGVYGSFILQRNEDNKREVREKRPFLNFTKHSKVNIDDDVYHSTPKIDDSIFDQNLIKINNPTDNLAINILVTLYDSQNKLCDVVNVDYLINGSTIVYLRNLSTTKKAKIYVSFLTVNGEAGLTYQDYSMANFNNFEDKYDTNAKNVRNTIINGFNEHNESLKGISKSAHDYVNGYWYRYKTNINSPFYNELVSEFYGRNK